MAAIGNVAMWADTFPDDLIPEILDLIIEAWSQFPDPVPTEHEVPITQRFRHVIKQTKMIRKLPVRIEREPAEDDSDTGLELGRIDLKFNPAGSAMEEVYFAFECKRVNSLKNKKWRSLASQYITEGMMRFVEDQYAPKMNHGGMIGYILNGLTAKSIRLVDNNIRKKFKALKMACAAGLVQSQLRPQETLLRETSHSLSPARTFRIHHIFLPCLGSKTPKAPASTTPTVNS